jgi:DNA polymerase I-like protein with 3'-5' exonuclease and polymerase domains/uracil-DNA glycosylase
MLENQFSFDPSFISEDKNPYNLKLKRDVDWNRANRRLLIIFQTVDGRDLKNGEMLTGDVGKTFQRVYKFARQTANRYTDNQTPLFSVCVANFGAYKHLHLKGSRRADAESQFSERIHALIKKIKPTHILVSGDNAMIALYPKIKDAQYKRGWIHKIKNEDDEIIKVTSSVDFTRLLENKGLASNLLGYFSRHMAYLMIGRNPHDLSQIKLQPRYIKTIEEFDLLMRKFDSATEVAIDTETRNLSVLHNKIYTIQFATNHNKEVGYVLALDHPQAHWDAQQRKYLKLELKKRFSAKTGPTLITFNGYMFDLHVIRQALKIPIIWLKVWEIMFAEHLLDENMSLLNDISSTVDQRSGKMSKFGGLSPTFCSYGNSHYLDAAFGKEERGSIGAIDPSRKDAVEYMAMDTVSILNIRDQEIARAAKLDIEGRNYKPFFLRHMMHQMSDAAHAMSHMRQDGSFIDIKYLSYLLSKQSPMRQELRRVEKQMFEWEEVQTANKELLGTTGFKAGSLFSKAVGKATNWIFKLSKPEHRKKLFIDIMQLAPVNKTKNGEDAIDKDFIAHYKDTNKVVALYGEHQGLTKLISTYIKGWRRVLSNNVDAITDVCLRAAYFLVDTGRLGSNKPNLQQIPSRGKSAKSIKRSFVAERGRIPVQFDYSAHEVRMWSVASGDENLASVFKIGQRLRKKYVKNPTDELKAKIKTDGDVHILNVKRIFNKVVDKSHPLRFAIKAVIFGLIYGKSAKSLGEDTKQAEIEEVRERLSELYNEKLDLQEALKKAP